MRRSALWLPVLLLLTANAWAGPAKVIDAVLRPTDSHTFVIDVTVEHADTGWKHYADRWEVLAPDGKVLGTRVLLHPHVGEQPFTRSLTLTIPPEVTQVTIRAHDSVHGWGQKTKTVPLPKEK